MKMTLHNNELLCRFYECAQKLQNLGLRGEVAMNAGVIVISCKGKNAAQLWRAPLRRATKNAGAVLTENRPTKEHYVFTIAA
jgi:hypothetical protein